MNHSGFLHCLLTVSEAVNFIKPLIHGKDIGPASRQHAIDSVVAFQIYTSCVRLIDRGKGHKGSVARVCM